MYLPPASKLRCVPRLPVLYSPVWRGLTGSLMSQIRTPSLNGAFGPAPIPGTKGFSRPVIMVFPEISIWPVNEPAGPGTNFTTFELAGSVTSRIVQPDCQKCPKYKYQCSPD